MGDSKMPIVFIYNHSVDWRTGEAVKLYRYDPGSSKAGDFLSLF